MFERMQKIISSIGVFTDFEIYSNREDEEVRSKKIHAAHGQCKHYFFSVFSVVAWRKSLASNPMGGPICLI